MLYEDTALVDEAPNKPYCPFRTFQAMILTSRHGNNFTADVCMITRTLADDNDMPHRE